MDLQFSFAKKEVHCVAYFYEGWTGNQGNHCNVTDLNGDGTKQKFGNNKFKIGGFKNGILFPKLF